MRLREQHSRFRGLPWYPIYEHIIIGGVGGIGGYFALNAARAGTSSITIYDDDIVEYGNLSGQVFNQNHVGKNKVDAIKEIANDYMATSNIDPRLQKITEEECMTGQYMVSCFDNMDGRKIMFEKWYEENKDNNFALFIDGRLEAQTFQCYFVTPDRADRYRETLVVDSSIPDLACTMKQTSHVAQMLASMMFSVFTNHRGNIKQRAEIFRIPYSIHGSITNMSFKIED
jgi:molybdopterin/thiamine biosynthesis adenylyltransferase